MRQELEAAYDKWASDYDADLGKLCGGDKNVVGEVVATVLSRNNLAFNPASHPCVVDFGCGTGAAGPLLHALGWKDIVGVDLSGGMLREAEKRGPHIYKRLVKAALPDSGFQAATFDVVHAAAMFAPGQAPPESFDEFLRVLRVGGVATFSVRCHYYDGEEGARHRARIQELETAQRWRRLQVTTEPYLPADDVECYVFVFEKC